MCVNMKCMGANPLHSELGCLHVGIMANVHEFHSILLQKKFLYLIWQRALVYPSTPNYASFVLLMGSVLSSFGLHTYLFRVVKQIILLLSFHGTRLASFMPCYLRSQLCTQ